MATFFTRAACVAGSTSVTRAHSAPRGPSTLRLRTPTRPEKPPFVWPSCGGCDENDNDDEVMVVYIHPDEALLFVLIHMHLLVTFHKTALCACAAALHSKR